MKPIHTSYVEAETLVFPGAITLKILLSGQETNGPRPSSRTSLSLALDLAAISTSRANIIIKHC